MPLTRGRRRSGRMGSGAKPCRAASEGRPRARCGSGEARKPMAEPRVKQGRRRAQSMPMECRLFHPEVGAWGTASTMAKLYLKVQWWVGLPGKWLSQFTRLLAFAMILVPFFGPLMWAYIRSDDILKNVVYGPLIRQQLDIYKPLREHKSGKAPVVIFVCGGAWIIGYKAWAFIMGQLFQEHGVLLISLDYRNFPQTSIGGMVQDAAAAIGWTLEHLEALGGDPENVTLMGQSCGAHITSLLLLEQAELEAKGQPGLEGWGSHSLKRWVGISGPYDILDLMPHLHARGLHHAVVKALMGQDVVGSSPYWRVQDLLTAGAAGRAVAGQLPPVHLFHGTADATVPSVQAKQFAEVLAQAGVPVSTRFYEGKSHTDPILEDPIQGEGDALMSDLLRLVLPEPAEPPEGGHDNSLLAPGLGSRERCPLWLKAQLLRWARLVNPF